MGFQPAVSRLDKVLGPALYQYLYLHCWAVDLRSHGVVMPDGPFADCAGCCHQAAREEGVHSVFVDFCFKLVHYASATRRWLEYKPPNTKYFLSNRDVRDFASDPINMARPANAGKDCSEFTAAEAVARRSQQVRTLLTVTRCSMACHPPTEHLCVIVMVSLVSV
jgi:hypothetical protein